MNIKAQLQTLLVLIPLLFVATVAAAYTLPGGSAPAGNTDAPLDVSANNQVKLGSLGVNTFLANGNALLNQHAIFNGMIRGGTPADTDSTVQFGDAASTVAVSANGSVITAGNYQSDSLKTGGGLKPLCADKNGVFYICGGASAPAATPSAVYLSIGADTDHSIYVTSSQSISEPVSLSVNLTYDGSQNNTQHTGYQQQIATTPDGQSSDSCYVPNSATITIPADSTKSSSIYIPEQCPQYSVAATIASYTPQTSRGGASIVVANDTTYNY